MWVGLLPSQYLPYNAKEHTADISYNARITVMKKKMVIEYPNRNVVEEGKVLREDFEFLQYKDTVDIARAKIILTDELSIIVQEQRQFVIFCLSKREKDDLCRSLLVSKEEEEDKKTRSDYLRYVREAAETYEKGKERCNCEKETGRINCDHSFEFINNFLHRVFYSTKEDLVKTYLTRKLIKILLKLDFLTDNFPSHHVEQLSCGTFPPKVLGVQKPYQSELGLFLPFLVEYHGVLQAKILLEKESEELTFLKRIKNYFLNLFSLEVQLNYLSGELCFNLSQTQTDRVWFGFSSFPETEIRIFLSFKGKRLKNLLVDGLMFMLVKKVEIMLKQGLVLPNMNDIPMTFLEDK